jgi:hypothetical protein
MSGHGKEEGPGWHGQATNHHPFSTTKAQLVREPPPSKPLPFKSRDVKRSRLNSFSRQLIDTRSEGLDVTPAQQDAVQNNNRNPPTCEILLVLHLLISSDHHFECRIFGHGDQFAVQQFAPS